MSKKSMIIIEIIIVIGLFIWYTYKELIPELKEQYGSSDKFMNTNKYYNMIELKIEDINFAIVLDQNNTIYHLFFLSDSSTCLYNQEIEGKPLEESIQKIVTIILENQTIKNNTFSMVYYEQENNQIKELFLDNFSQKNIELTIEENRKTLKERAEELGINTKNQQTILSELDFYSKEITGIGKKKEKIDTSSLANQVYQKLEEYVFTNQIDTQAKDNSNLPIIYIPADSTLKHYPTMNSWYYVENKKIYAYIEFNINKKKEGYCYQGSFDNKRKGECSYE